MDTPTILSIVSLAWLLLVSVAVFILRAHYTKLTKGVSQKDLITSLNHFINISERNSDDIKILNERLANEIKLNKLHLQRIGFKRFNPFTDTGGDQSFALALLDDHGDGLVISSLHSRENTRLYAKKLVKGETQDQVLSREEVEVIKQALK